MSLRPVFAPGEADRPEVSREPQGDFPWQRRTCSVAQSSWSCPCLPSDRLACSEQGGGLVALESWLFSQSAQSLTVSAFPFRADYFEALRVFDGTFSR